MNISKLELVRGIQSILSDESKWCKYVSARDVHGHPISPMEPGAVSFCIYGAARRAAGKNSIEVGSLKPEIRAAWMPFWDVMQSIGRYDRYKVSTGSVGYFGDVHTYAEVMERLKEVEAKYLEEEENAIAA